jgi:hypothetical protein
MTLRENTANCFAWTGALPGHAACALSINQSMLHLADAPLLAAILAAILAAPARCPLHASSVSKAWCPSVQVLFIKQCAQLNGRRGSVVWVLL